MVLVNRDLFQFTYTHPFGRSFNPETDRKGDYILSKEITLKPASYTLSLGGETTGPGNGIFLARSSGEKFTAESISSSFLQNGFAFTVENTVHVSIGITYDPATELNFRSITIHSSKVLYKESLTRHLVLSTAISLCFLYVILRLCKPTLFGFSEEALRRAERTALFLLALTLLSNFPNLDNVRYIVGDDLNFHLFRIEGIASGLQKGYFPARIYLTWLEDYGVGAGFYYPDLLLYIPALLRLAGFDVLGTYNFLILLCTFFSLLTIFITAKRICGGSSFAGAGAACIYAFSAYRLICIYYRSALGEVQAFIFYPLVILGLYEIFHDRPERWWVFALGFFGLISTHLISVVIAGIFTLAYCLINVRVLFGNKRVIPGILKAAILNVLLTASFWVPMLEQTKNNQLFFQSFMANEDLTLTAANFLKLKYLFVPFNEWGGFSPYPGWSLLQVILLRILCLIRFPKRRFSTDMLLGFGIVSLILSTDLFPWAPFAWFLKRIQVSWRFLAPATVCLAVCCGDLLAGLLPAERPRLRKFGLAALALFCIGLSIPFYRECLTKHIGINNGQILADKEVQAGEYMPLGLTIEYIYTYKDTVLPDQADAEVVSHKRNGLDFRFSFTASPEGETRFTLPLIYHFGYRASFTDADGNTTPVPVGKDDKGLIQLCTEGHDAGSLRAYYAKTTLQKLSEGVTAATCFAIFILLLRRRRTRSI